MLRRLYAATWGRLFARIYDGMLSASEDAGLRDMRRDLLAQASGRTLEIGAGTGLNMDLYPDGIEELVLTEPSPHMASRLRRKHPSATVIEATAERLPFPDHSFDTVAVTLVLCTVPDQPAALREIARVLKPEGRLLFLEHVRADDPGLARWQDRLHGPWYVFGDGCHCNRDTLAAIDASPLRVETAEPDNFPKGLPIVRPMLRGAARA